MNIIKRRANQQSEYRKENYLGVIGSVNRDLQPKDDVITSYDVMIATEKQVIRNVSNATNINFETEDKVRLIRVNRTEWQIVGYSTASINIKEAEGIAINAKMDESKMDQCYMQ